MAFKDDGGHSDLVAEVRHTLLAQMQRQSRAFDAGRAFDLPAQVLAPLNHLAASVEPGFEGGFATGYDAAAGTTIAPFVVGISVVGGPDIVTGSGPTLLSLALADGATYGYTFAELTGNALNFLGDATYDLLVDAAVTRAVAGPLGRAYHVPGSAGSAPAYGHVEGLRHSQSGISTVTYELVAKFGTTGLGIEILDGPWVGVVSRFQFGLDGAGNLAAGLGGSNVAPPASGSLATRWHHYVWQNDGSTTKFYIDGVLVASAAIGFSGTDGTGAAAAIAFGGLQGSGGSNWNSFFAHFAAYHNTVLTPAQIAAHFAVSGCPL